MRILIFNGSPRILGNTDLLVQSALKGIDRAVNEVDYFRLNDMDIKPCQNCGGCTETRVCVIKDKMQQIYPAIRKADRVILASPIYFSGLSAQAKVMIDRCQPFWCEKYMHNMPIEGRIHRKGLLVLVGGMKREIGAECSDATATAFFRSISVEEHRVLAYLGIDNRGGIKDHPTALQDVYEAARRLSTQ